MTASQKIFVGVFAALALFAAVFAKHFYPDLDTGAIITLCIGTLTGLGVTHLSADTAPAEADKTPNGQSGFARVGALVMLSVVVVGAFALGGCTTTTASVYSGLYTQAKAGVQVFDDNTLTTMRDLVCAQPYAAIQRHPEMQAGIVTLCGPLVNTTSIDPAQVQQLLNIAKQIGVAK